MSSDDDLCVSCAKWVRKRVTRYADMEVVNFTAPEGQGHCDILDKDFPPDFGCRRHIAGGEVDQVVVAVKPMQAHQHSWAGPCPDCKGRGSGLEENATGCHRCAGTGLVRYYGDGHVGEERTRLHPKEKEQLAKGPLICRGCKNQLQINWVACPICGIPVFEKDKEEPERIASRYGGTNATPEAMAAAYAKRAAQAGDASPTGEQ